MTVLCVLGALILAGLAVALGIVMLVDRARKAIDALKFDMERL